MRVRRSVVSALTASSLLCSVPKLSDARDLSSRQSNRWYALHGSLTGGFAFGAVGTRLFWPEPRDARFENAPEFERFTERYFSRWSGRGSDLSLWMGVVAPLGTLAIDAPGYAWGNAALVYGQSLSVSVLLNLVVKRSVLRARPYTHNPSDEANSYRAGKGVDALYSFYSGHASLSFASAAAGSYLFSATHQNQTAGALHWGISLALAGFTGHARIRAGSHYPTDVVAGALVGVGLGLGVPLLHGVNAPLAPSEIVAASGGMLGGVVLGWLLPTGVQRDVARWSPSMTPRTGGAVLTVSGTLR